MTTDPVRSARPPVCVALDTASPDVAVRWARAVAPSVSLVKVGLELFCAAGPAVVDAVRVAVGDDVGIFLDLKLHDIPNTVAGAARAVGALEPDFLTLHASGGTAMVRAAAEAAPAVQIAAITVLTSLSGHDLHLIGLAGPAQDAVLRLASLAAAAGAKALVCSPQEVGMVRAEVGDAVTLITPGVRPAGADPGDQARVATPASALADGADVVVVGRPITGASDPGAAAAELAASLRG